MTKKRIFVLYGHLFFRFFSSIKWIFFFCRTIGPTLKHFLSDIHKKCPIVRQVRRISTALHIYTRYWNIVECDVKHQINKKILVNVVHVFVINMQNATKHSAWSGTVFGRVQHVESKCRTCASLCYICNIDIFQYVTQNSTCTWQNMLHFIFLNLYQWIHWYWKYMYVKGNFNRTAFIKARLA